jgi:hypothetical protein
MPFTFIAENRKNAKIIYTVMGRTELQWKGEEGKGYERVA